uniref:Uncharacterized protein n=1 Tax=Timspurckia oligopyrenoides TaxID=708627 RepID=A0A7S1ETL3_9RHOD|mmetsp:Transcript_6365/g.11352  ORF Transcript_6365/g.11352 Transcript_6365/m.11352 type:complete len:185 (+) Transcript_6365:254-808(+)
MCVQEIHLMSAFVSDRIEFGFYSTLLFNIKRRPHNTRPILHLRSFYHNIYNDILTSLVHSGTNRKAETLCDPTNSAATVLVSLVLVATLHISTLSNNYFPNLSAVFLSLLILKLDTALSPLLHSPKLWNRCSLPTTGLRRNTHIKLLLTSNSSSRIPETDIFKQLLQQNTVSCVSTTASYDVNP